MTSDERKVEDSSEKVPISTSTSERKETWIQWYHPRTAERRKLYVLEEIVEAAVLFGG